MARFLLLMHQDSIAEEDPADWEPYLSKLRESKQFEGGSSIGGGSGYRRDGVPATTTDHLVGYLIVRAAGAEAARSFLDGNPVYEAGGTVEIRELIED